MRKNISLITAGVIVAGIVALGSAQAAQAESRYQEFGSQNACVKGQGNFVRAGWTTTECSYVRTELRQGHLDDIYALTAWK